MMNDKQLASQVSILIKTFDRKRSLVRLLRSLAKLECVLPILIADDSHEPYKDAILKRFPQLQIEYYVMPLDSGLSAGRNLLLGNLTTPYFILCDDDFYFDASTDINRMLTKVKLHGLDIAGGSIFNRITVTSVRRLLSVLSKPRQALQFVFGRPTVSRYYGYFSASHPSCILTITNEQPEATVLICDMVSNFFIGHTEAVRRMNGWDEKFKLGEHEDFFYRAKLHHLKTAFLNDFSIHHYPSASRKYLRYRERSFELKKYFPEKFHFRVYQEINTDTNELLFSYHQSPTDSIQKPETVV